MIQQLSQAYGAAAAWRRAWYAREPGRQHRLDRPVISVGNLRVGGSGKTPAEIENQERQANLARAIESIDSDPFVRELVENFDARIKDTSIKPLQ